MAGEFDWIARHWCPAGPWPPHVVLGNGDDAALLQPTPGMALAVSSDMLVQGRHFLPDVDPEDLGHKALAVNLSDLAAMGARPLACTLALALPGAPTEAWSAALARGFLALAQAHGCPLVGGDTTAGPLTLCVTVLGEVPAPQASARHRAQPGDEVWVSGALGLARLGLALLRGEQSFSGPDADAARERLLRPTPRVALGLALRGFIHAAADVSDGLVADLGHICAASGVVARLDAQALWQSAMASALHRLPAPLAWHYALAGGDDYELVFTAPAAQRPAIEAAAARAQTPVARIGRIEPGPPASHPLTDGTSRVQLCDAAGRPFDLPAGVSLAGFDHFATMSA